MSQDKAIAIDDEGSFPAAEPYGKPRPSAMAPKENKKGVSKEESAVTADEWDENLAPLDVEGEENPVNIMFHGKGKSKPKRKFDNGFSALSALGEDEDGDVDANDVIETEGEKDEEAGVLEFNFGKKKKKPKKKLLGEVNLPPQAAKEEPQEVAFKEADNRKQKKKKRDKTVQEEDVVNKILTELGMGPSSISSSSQHVEQPIEAQSEVVEAEDEDEEAANRVETAAARKKKEKNKKKKEREKEKKAAAAAGKKDVPEVKEEPPSSEGAVDNRKLPKHVREKQEKRGRGAEEEGRGREADGGGGGEEEVGRA